MQHITKPCGSRRSHLARSLCSITLLVTTASSATFSDRGGLADDRPHILEGDVADLIVPLHGGLCTGTPIAGTLYVVTAAHCVLTDSGEVRQRAVVRDGVLYPAASVLVDTAYHDHPSVELDAAVLIMEQVIPGPSAQLGLSLPDRGRVTLAGFQPVKGVGTSVKVSEPIGPAPERASETAILRALRPEGCEVSVESLVVSATRVTVPCGLVPGASGGPLLAAENGGLVVVGILSTVTVDLSANGIVPLESLHELLAHPERYLHDFATSDAHRNDNRSPDAIDRAAP